LAREARDFLLSHRWCLDVRSQHLAWAVAGVIGVFIFRIRPAMPDVDEDIWVIVGDLPPAYIVRPKRDGWQTALRGYVQEMSRWVRAVRARRPVDNLIPVNTPPTLEYARMLGSRISFIRRHFLSVPGAQLGRDT
jgi:hypothetical protein